MLDKVFSVILRLLHPYAPFITEELWAGTGGAGTIQFAEWPQPRSVEGATAEHAAKVDSLYELVTAGRYQRNNLGIDPKRKIQFPIQPSANEDFFRSELPLLKRLLNAEAITIDRNYSGGGQGWNTNAGTVFVVGAAAVEADRTQFTKQLADIKRQLKATDAKLANENFVSKAAPIAVQREKDKQQQLREQREKVQGLLRALQ